MARARVRRPSFFWLGFSSAPRGAVSSSLRRGAPAACRALAFAILAGAAGCGGAATNEASKNRTFYDWSLGDGSQAFERPYPRLNWPEKTENPRFIGVSVLKDQ